MVSHVWWVVSTLGFSQYMQFENIWCTPCAVCVIPNAPTGGGARDGQIKVCGNQNICGVSVCPLYAPCGGREGELVEIK